MANNVRKRSDLNFVRQNMPEPVEFDYSAEVTDKDMTAMDKAMMHRSGLSGVELHQKLNDGILVSGEEW